MASKKNEIPSLMNFWGGLYAAVPKIYIPGTKFDVGFILIFSMVFSCIRLASEYFVDNFTSFDIADQRSKDMAAYIASASHSILMVPACWQTLRSQPYKPSAALATAPKYYQDTVLALLSLTTAYMLYDFVFLFRTNNWSSLHPDDVPFAAHHVVTVVYMNSARLVGAGHISALTLMWSGEFTNPLQNAHSISRFAIQMVGEESLWHFFHPYIELVFAAFYFLFRALLAPPQIAHLSYDLLTKEGRKNVPWYVSICWIPLCSGIIIGSIPWTLEALDMVKDGLVVKYDKSFDYGPRYEL